MKAGKKEWLAYCKHLRETGVPLPTVALMNKFGINRQTANLMWRTFISQKLQEKKP